MLKDISDAHILWHFWKIWSPRYETSVEPSRQTWVSLCVDVTVAQKENTVVVSQMGRCTGPVPESLKRGPLLAIWENTLEASCFPFSRTRGLFIVLTCQWSGMAKEEEAWTEAATDLSFWFENIVRMKKMEIKVMFLIWKYSLIIWKILQLRSIRISWIISKFLMWQVYYFFTVWAPERRPRLPLRQTARWPFGPFMLFWWQSGFSCGMAS